MRDRRSGTKFGKREQERERVEWPAFGGENEGEEMWQEESFDRVGLRREGFTRGSERQPGGNESEVRSRVLRVSVEEVEVDGRN